MPHVNLKPAHLLRSLYNASKRSIDFLDQQLVAALGRGARYFSVQSVVHSKKKDKILYELFQKEDLSEKQKKSQSRAVDRKYALKIEGQRVFSAILLAPTRFKPIYRRALIASALLLSLYGGIKSVGEMRIGSGNKGSGETKDLATFVVDHGVDRMNALMMQEFFRFYRKQNGVLKPVLFASYWREFEPYAASKVSPEVGKLIAYKVDNPSDALPPVLHMGVIKTVSGNVLEIVRLTHPKQAAHSDWLQVNEDGLYQFPASAKELPMRYSMRDSNFTPLYILSAQEFSDVLERILSGMLKENRPSPSPKPRSVGANHSQTSLTPEQDIELCHLIIRTKAVRCTFSEDTIKREAFIQAAQNVVTRLEEAQELPEGTLKTSWLVALMTVESGRTLSASVPNAVGSGARGLIQFMPDVVRELEKQTSEPSPFGRGEVYQLENWVYLYFSNRLSRGEIATFEDLVWAVTYPRCLQDDEQLVARRGTKVYRQNPGWDRNGDGVIYPREIPYKYMRLHGECLQFYLENFLPSQTSSVRQGGKPPQARDHLDAPSRGLLSQSRHFADAARGARLPKYDRDGVRGLMLANLGPGNSTTYIASELALSAGESHQPTPHLPKAA